MMPPETNNTTPEHPFEDKHDTLTSEELTPSKSFHQRMQRNPDFMFYVEEHK